jgi:hypothetical protein
MWVHVAQTQNRVEELQHTVAALNGFARRGVLTCKACGARCNWIHIIECEALRQLEPVNSAIWFEINLDALLRLKDNKVITESITVPATLISTAESVNKMIRHFTILKEFDCIPNFPPPVPDSQKPAKRRPTHLQTSPPAGTPPTVNLMSPQYSPPRGRITLSHNSSSARTQKR